MEIWNISSQQNLAWKNFDSDIFYLLQHIDIRQAMKFSPEKAREFLQIHFGYSAFRSGQEEVIRSVVEGKDTLVVMPTGGGKSMCYQIPALLSKGTALIVSPLVALMKDQVDALTRANIRATLINSTLPFSEINQRLHNARFGAYKLIYVSPERLENEKFIEALSLIELSFLAVDEAHCISEWGHDFRPAYLTIPAANEKLGRLPIVALTATATPEVQDDIIKNLGMKQPNAIIRGFDRPNLNYRVEQIQNKIPRLVDICAESGGSNIIYCASRRRVEEFTAVLREHRIHSAGYHGGMANGLRKSVQEHFIEGSCSTIVATNAFGMGVDKSNVRNVVHLDMTLTLEAYYQEAGRAGRDGNPSNCTMLYHFTDRKLQDFFIRSTYPEQSVLEKIYDFLFDLHNTPLGVKPSSAILLDDVQIGNRLSLPVGTVGGVIALFERSGILRRGSAHGLAGLRFTTSRERLMDYHANTQIPERKNALVALLRTVGAEALEEMAYFDLDAMSRKQEITMPDLLEAIRAFQYARLLRFEPPETAGGLTMLLERMPLKRTPLDLNALAERRERAQKKLALVQRYSETPECKRNFLLKYFQENDIVDECGRCSSCTETVIAPKARSARRNFLLQTILSVSAELGGRFGRTVIGDVAKGTRSEKVKKFDLVRAGTFGAAKEFPKQEIMEEIDVAISDKLLSLSPDVHPTLSVSETGWRLIQTVPPPINIRFHGETERVDETLLARLETLRKELSAREDMNPQAILDDETLRKIVIELPQNMSAFQRIKGIGNLFLNRFAPAFLRDITVYLASEQTIPEEKVKLTETMKTTLELAQQGLSLEEISEKRKITIGTVAQQIQDLLEQNFTLDKNSLVSDKLIQAVKVVIRSRTNVPLGEIREALDMDCDFAELRVALAFARKER